VTVEHLRVYLPPIVLIVWAIAVTAGYTGDLVSFLFTSALVITACVAAEELRARYANYRQGRHEYRRHT
jgi:hypothetical protein